MKYRIDSCEKVVYITVRIYETAFSLNLRCCMANIIELPGNNRKRVRMVRSYPLNTLEDVLQLVKVLYDSNSGLPVSRINLAEVLGIAPSSSKYTTLLNSSSKYGLTKGGYRSSKIELTGMGLDLIQSEDIDKHDSLLKKAASDPDIFKKFYLYYENRKMPADNIAEEYIQTDLKVKSDLSAECLNLIKLNGTFSGLISEIKGSFYVGEVIYDGASVNFEAGGNTGQLEPYLSEQTKNIEMAPGKLLLAYFGADTTAEYLREMLEDLGIQFEDKELTYPDPFSNSSPVFSKAASIEFDAAILLVGESTLTRVYGGRETSTHDMTMINFVLANEFFKGRIVSILDNSIEFAPTGGRIINYEEANLESIILPLLSELRDIGFLVINTKTLDKK